MRGCRPSPALDGMSCAATNTSGPGTVIHALRPREGWPVIAVHEGLSPSSRRLRYSAPTRQLTPRMVRVLTDLRPQDHEAYAAWRGGRPIGIVRWIRTPGAPGAAELALEVVDAEQGVGVGRALAAFAAVQAWRAGVRTMLISVDPDNVRVHHWLGKLRARAFPTTRTGSPSRFTPCSPSRQRPPREHDVRLPRRSSPGRRSSPPSRG
jgi:GNAT superfamily N-acetyltransferase